MSAPLGKVEARTPRLLKGRAPIVPVLSDAERRAYQAAWRIQGDRSLSRPDYNDFACESTRRSRQIDRMAKIIREEMAGPEGSDADLFSEVHTLIAADAVHIRSGVGVNETSDDLLLCLLYREVAELDTARMPHRKASELDELGDILTVLARYAIRKGFSPADIESAAIRKIGLRYIARSKYAPAV